MKLHRRRYWRIVWFFARTILSLLLWEVFLPRLPGGRLVRLGAPGRRLRLAARFRALATEMGGVLIKLGQFLSARADVLPSEITEELSGLQDEVPPDPFPPIQRMIEEELGAPLSELFEEFQERTAIGASLGQVYQAHLPGGEPVMVKVQRPEIEMLVATDLAALRWAVGWLNRYRPLASRADLDALLDEFSRTLYEELDYIAEGHNAERFAENFVGNPKVRIPLPRWSHTTKRVLTLECVGGIKITDYQALTEAGIDRGAVAQCLFGTYLQQVFIDGFFHADPHPGNLFVRPLGDPPPKGDLSREFHLVFVDFGMVGHLTPQVMDQLRESVIGLAARDVPRLIESWDRLGFFLPRTDLRPIEAAAEKVFARFYGLSMGELARLDHREFAALALEFRDLIFQMPLQLPQDFIFMGRMLGILSGLATGLDPDFNIFEGVEPFARELLAAEKEEWAERLLNELQTMGALLWRLPRLTEETMLTLSRGGLEVRITQSQELERLVGRLERGMDRLLRSIVLASLILTGAFLLIGGQEKLGWALLALAGLIGISLFLSH
ncbi:MAG: AarF/ABC1/UbiB kinase family protein [Anaerolineae bacterium]